MKLSIVIMAHPERSKDIPYLKLCLGNDTPVIYDEKNNLWDTCKRAWLAGKELALKNGSPYVLVLQDDAIVCHDFRQKAEALLTEPHLYSFYAGEQLSGLIDEAVEKGKTEIVTDFIFNEIALCLQTDLIDEMIAYCDENNAQNDQLINIWAKRRVKPICYPLPSLIDHRDEPSIYRRNYKINIGNKPRKAYWFIENKYEKR